MKNTVDYNTTAKFLHWIPVVLIAVQFPLGWLMKPTGRDEVPVASVNLHFSIGMLILIVLTVRLWWRFLHPVGMEPSLAPLQKRIAHTAHWLLYAASFGTVLTGWAHASVRGWPIKFFGLFPVPAICAQGGEIPHFLGDYHKGFGLALLTLICVHFAGVMFHEYVQGDKILVRMLPRGASEWWLRLGRPAQS